MRGREINFCALADIAMVCVGFRSNIRVAEQDYS